MNNGREHPEPVEAEGGGAAEDGTKVDTGEPVESLRDMAVVPGPGFFARLRNRIERRLLWSDITTFSWSALAHTIMEHLSALFDLLGAGGHDNDEGGG